jgi:nitrite reductase/ring-hydroxylating ferredoxin subunit
MLLAGAAAGLLPSCSQFDGTVEASGGSVTLGFAQFPSLASAGGSATVDVKNSFPIVVVRTAADQAVALSATCTHAYCIMRYAPDINEVHCDCHDANFDLHSGAVLRGPTRIPIPTYAATVGASSITVQLA